MTSVPYLLLAESSVSTALSSSWKFLHAGGLFMIPLGVTSIIGLMAILYKFMSLAKDRIIPDSLAKKVADFQLADTAGTSSLLKECEQGESTLARLTAVALRHRGKSQSDMIQAVEASAREETSRLHAGIGVLDIAITVGPLLGLLGTASGLVTIFQGLSDTADHIAIARGIAIALNTTIFGLAIAVPCVVAHGFFTRRIEVLTARLESLLADLASACQKPENDA